MKNFWDRLQRRLFFLLALPACGCGYAQYENRFQRAMRVLEHHEQKRQALGTLWEDQDEVDAEGKVVRAGTGVRYQLPKQLTNVIARPDWPVIPRFISAEHVIGVMEGTVEGGQGATVYCYVAAPGEKQPEPSGDSAPVAQEDVDEVNLHQRVKEAWKQDLGDFSLTELTQPKGNEFGKDDFGMQRKFEFAQSKKGEDTEVRVYLYPASSAAQQSPDAQVAIYFEIHGSADTKQLYDAVNLSLETLSTGSIAVSTSDPNAAPTF